MPIKASAQEPQATGGRVLAEQALAGKGGGGAEQQGGAQEHGSELRAYS